MLKLIKSCIVASAIIIANCSPVYAVSMCPGAADLAGIYSQMQYVNNELAKEGKEPKYSKEKELQDVYNRLNNKYLPIYIMAIEEGFSNPNRNPMPAWKMLMSKCRHWMYMNDIKDY
jgi:hypothetical protein